MPPKGEDFNKNNKVHNLEDVNDRLYRRDLADRKMRHIDSLHDQHYVVNEAWKGEAPKKEETKEEKIRHTSMFRKFFHYSLIFAGIAIVVALFMFFSGNNTISTNDIEINVLGNSFTGGGEELQLQVEVVNKNQGALELADLFIEYEKGGDAVSGAKRVSDRTSLGTIEAGKTANKSFFVTLFGQEGTTRTVDFRLQYRLQGSNAIFTKTTSFPVTIKSAPVALTIDSPKSVTPNQEITFTVKTTSNSKNTLSGMLLRVEYPNGFNFKKATPSPTSFNNVWNLGDIAPGGDREITITGTMYGQDGEDRAFHVYTGAADARDATKIGVTYNSLLETITLVKPFLAAHIFINGSDKATSPVLSNSTVNVRVNYTNNLPTQVTDAEVTLALTGNALDTSSVIVPKGFYDSARGVITWNTTTNPDLQIIQPNDQGNLDFTFDVLPLISGGQTISSPNVKLAVSIKGKQPDQGGSLSEVNNFEQKTAVVSSNLGFSADAFYKSGPFTNTGPIPPKANQPTTYTITWRVMNSSNALADAVATSQLPTYVDWVGVISPTSEKIEYDSTTRNIRWTIGAIAPNTGLAGLPKTVSFQVRLNPSITQVGSTPKLVLDSRVTARDTFTGETLTANRAATSTLLTNDTGFPANGQTVTQ
ncbi:MAG: DUF11 domain-containing protein [Candidatus Pacebacteria bacterium]|nr:DUF11 domain-containing protein [Candidatus Paceibacterota bacterium]